MTGLKSDLVGMKVSVKSRTIGSQTTPTKNYEGSIRAVWHSSTYGLLLIVEDVDGDLHEAIVTQCRITK